MRWLLLGLCACGGVAVQSPPAVELPEPDPVLREVTRDAVHRGEREGWSLEEVGDARFAVASRSETTRVIVPSAACRVFVLVRASGVVEAAAALYLPDGRRIDRDLGRSGEAPAVVGCAGEAPLEAFWHVSVRGAGLVRGLTFAVEPSAAGSPSPPVASDLALALQRRGFAPRGPERVLRIAPGEGTRFPVSLEAHRCLTLVLRGGPASLALVEGDRPVARDGVGGEQAVQLCAGSEARALEAIVTAPEAAEVRVQRFDGDERGVGGDDGLWLGERAPPVRAEEAPMGARTLDLSPAQVVEVDLPEREGCTTVRVTAGPGSRGVWLGEPGEPQAQVEGCVRGRRARMGSIGGGRVWLVVGEAVAEPTRRPPAQRGARR